MLRQSVEAREVQWGREPLLVVQSAVFVCLQDENPGGNDVAREVNDEGNEREAAVLLITAVPV